VDESSRAWEAGGGGRAGAATWGGTDLDELVELRAGQVGGGR
jgi:hypothetical protein